MGLIRLKNLILHPVFILVGSAYGIYLASFGLRLEHVAVYGLFTVVILISILKLKVHLHYKSRIPLFLFAAFVTYAVIFWILNSKALFSVYILGQMDRFLIPIMVILTISYYYRRAGAYYFVKKDLITVSKLILLLSSIAASLALIQLILNDSTFLAPFLPAADIERGTTASRSLIMGRYTGIFSSPFDAGIVYSLSLFCFIYLNKKGSLQNSHYLMVLLIIFGGLLTVSKAFLLGILFFGIWIFSEYKVSKLKPAIYLIILLTIGTVILTYYFSDEWRGYSRLVRLIDIETVLAGDAIKVYTGNRFTTEGTGTLNEGWDQVVSAFPMGHGFANLGVVDNAYYEVSLIGGIFGLFFLIIFFGYSLFIGLSNRKLPEGTLLILMTLYSVIASIGAPAITKNRYSVLYFVLFSLIMILINEHKKRN